MIVPWCFCLNIMIFGIILLIMFRKFSGEVVLRRLQGEHAPQRDQRLRNLDLDLDLFSDRGGARVSRRCCWVSRYVGIYRSGGARLLSFLPSFLPWALGEETDEWYL